MIRKNEIETLIICKDREFKQRAVKFMNNIAFHAEKMTVESLKEGSAKLQGNPKLLNVVIDGTMYGEVLNDEFDNLIELTQRNDISILLYLASTQMKSFEHGEHGLKNLHIHALPFDKAIFNDVFHKRGQTGNEKSAIGGALGQIAATNAKSKPKPAPPPPKNLSAFEASNHIRDTIAMINILENNRSAMDQLAVIGQRFNGIVGAFGYLKAKKGCQELVFLSDMIDMIVRTYQKNEQLTAISDSHFKMMVDGAKYCFRILQFLRDEKEVPEEVLGPCSELKQTFEAATDIDKKDIISQDQIDDLLLGGGG